MKPLVSMICRAVAATLLLSTFGVPWAALGEIAVAAATPPNAPQSVFNSQPGFGKDPFFPKSSRLISVVPVRVDPALLNTGVPDFIVLKGLSVMNQRKLAIINNHTVAPDEEFNLKVNGRHLKAKCIEIKENSVIIEVNGSRKELQLRTGL